MAGRSGNEETCNTYCTKYSSSHTNCNSNNNSITKCYYTKSEACNGIQQCPKGEDEKECDVTNDVGDEMCRKKFENFVILNHLSL